MIDAAQIREIFAELLDRISDDQLREQVVETWVEACREGGWEELDAVEQMPFSLLTDCGGVDFIQHTKAVTLGAIGLAEAQEKLKTVSAEDFDEVDGQVRLAEARISAASKS